MDDPDDRSGKDGGTIVRPRKKTRVTMYLEPDILESYRAQAEDRGAGYQTLINEALWQTLHPESAPLTVDTLRRVLREEFDRHFTNRR